MGTDGEGNDAGCLYGCPLNCKYCINNFCHETDNVFDSYRIPEALTRLMNWSRSWHRMKFIFWCLTGVTFGGGEPLQQAGDSSKKYADKHPQMENENRNVTVRAAGKRRFAYGLVGWMDYWHKKHRMKSIKNIRAQAIDSSWPIWKNCFRLSMRKRFVVRVPHIPRFNTDEDVRQSIHVFRTEGRSAHRWVWLSCGRYRRRFPILKGLKFQGNRYEIFDYWRSSFF